MTATNKGSGSRRNDNNSHNNNRGSNSDIGSNGSCGGVLLEGQRSDGGGVGRELREPLLVLAVPDVHHPVASPCGEGACGDDDLNARDAVSGIVMQREGNVEHDDMAIKSYA